MEYTENAKMMMGYLDEEEEIINYDDNMSDSENESEAVIEPSLPFPENAEEKIMWHEQIRMIQLRSHLNKLLENVKLAQYTADRIREELKKCRCKIQLLEDERDKLFTEINKDSNEQNRPVADRICAAHEKTCKELEAEQKLEAIIIERLDQAEIELALAEIERGKFLLAEDELLQKEQKLNQEKTEQAMVRLQKEELYVKQSLYNKRKDEKLKLQMKEELDRRHHKAVEEAEKCHNKVNKFLSQTMAKLKKRQDEEAERYKVDMNKRMEMLLKLKKDISHNRDNLRAIKARENAKDEEEKMSEYEERMRIEAEGGNAEEIWLAKKRRNEAEKIRQQFEAEQKVKKVEIVKKIVREEENLKKKKKQQPYLWEWPQHEKEKRVAPIKKKPVKFLETYIAETTAELPVDDKKEDDNKKREKSVYDEKYSICTDSFGENEDRESFESFSVDSNYTTMLKDLETNMKIVPVSPWNQNQSRNINAFKAFPSGYQHHLTRSNNNEWTPANISGNADEEDIAPLETVREEDQSRAETSVEEELSTSPTVETENEKTVDEDVLDEATAMDDTPVVEEPISSESEEDEEEEEAEKQVSLEKPEFEGLWNKQTKPYKVPKDNDQLLSKPVGKSKMEKEILKRTLDKTREGIVITQKAAGREFSGCSYYSKPDVIHFKDFDVGKTYKKTVKLTNVSYTVNYIKFVDITDLLKDFIKIHFEPPGQMSAGLTCSLTVTFKPMINEDLSGEVKFLTQTGPFNIPLKCTTKKTELSIDVETIDFGTHVIGETLKQCFTLTNSGALATKYDFYKITPMKPFSSFTEADLKDMHSLYTKEEILLSQQYRFIPSPSMKSQAKRMTPGLSKTFLLAKPSEHFSTTNVNDKAQEEPETGGEGGEDPEKPTAPDDTETQAPANANEELTREATPDKKEMDLEDGSPSLLNVVSASKQKISSLRFPFIVESFGDIDINEICSLDGLQVGPNSAGEIGPFSTIKLEVIWKPTIPGKVKTPFRIVFSDALSKPLDLFGLAEAINLPVWVERQAVDLNICMFDRLYQDTIVVHNRASTALKLTFEVAPELKNHMEILPKTGYIQAQSQFSAQLKFLPRNGIFSDAKPYISEEIGVLEAPVTIRVAGQTTPVVFTAHAVVTRTDIEINVKNIDFGYCTIHESVKKSIELTNKSILPQQFGFVGLPEYVDVQPNDGFGTLLPLETYTVDVIFSPSKANEYKFDLVCRSIINRDFKVSCVGVGVHTPLELSHQVVHLASTALYDKTMATIHVINSHTDTNEFTHPVPRIGKGPICPVGPTSFEFVVPEDAPFIISPSVGTVQPGKKQKVYIQFTPTLDEDEIKEEALRIIEKAKEKVVKAAAESQEKVQLQKRESQLATSMKAKKKQKSVSISSNENATSVENTKINGNKSNNTSNNRLSRNSNASESSVEKEDILDFVVEPYAVPIPTLQLDAESRDVNNSNPRSNENNSSDQDGKSLNIKELESLASSGTLASGVSRDDDAEDSIFEDEEEPVKGLSKEKTSTISAAASKSKAVASTDVSQASLVPSEELKQATEPVVITKNSPEYVAAVSSLIRQYKGQFKSYTIPCYVASGSAGMPGQLEYSIHNSLYLQVHCPAIKPPLVVISDGGRRTVDFGSVSIGQTSQKSVTVQNISGKDIELSASMVNPFGPFLILNALRPLSPGGTHTIILTFTPEKGHVFQEDLCIKTLHSTLYLTLCGTGVSPLVNVSVTNGLMELGAVLNGDFVEKTFTIENTSILSIDYIIKQDSLSPLRHTKAQVFPQFLLGRNAEKTKNYVGPHNYNGKNVFDIVPTKGTIQGGETKEICVTFAPDHESDLYSDGVRIELFDQEESHFFKVTGQGKPRIMYLDGTEPLNPTFESLAFSPAPFEEDDDEIDPTVSRKIKENKTSTVISPPCLITLRSVMKNDNFQSTSHVIYVGCVRSMAVSQKKNGEFSIEGVQALTQKGFTVEPQKGMVEAGAKKPVTFTWVPPAGHEPSKIIEESVVVTLKCDVTELITLMIRAMVVSA